MPGRKSRSVERGGDEDRVDGDFLDEIRREYGRRRSRPGVVMSGAGFAGEVVRQIAMAREAARLSQDRVDWLGTAIVRTDDQLARVASKKKGLEEEREAEKVALVQLNQKVEMMERMIADPDEGLKMELAELCACRSGCQCIQEVLVKLCTREGEIKTVRLAPEQLSDLGEGEEESDWSEAVAGQESVVRTRTVHNVEEVRTETRRNLIQANGVSARRVEREVNRNVREEQVNVEQEVTTSPPLGRRGAGVGQVAEEMGLTDEELRGAEGSNRLRMVEMYEMMVRYSRASLWTDVEAAAGQVAMAWRAFTRRGGEATADRMLVRIRFESRCVL